MTIFFIQLEIQKENQKNKNAKKNEKKKSERKKSSEPEFKVKLQPNVPTKCPECQKVFISDRVMKIHWARNHYVAPRKKTTEKQNDNVEVDDSVSK